jgi:serine phosphatase RsbU (regulator of sigma subunit)
MLDKLNELVEETFSRSDSSIKDGMDLAICKLNKETNELEYAGANNSLYLVRDSAIVEEQDERRNVSDEKSGKTLIEIKADKQPIGKYDFRQAFTNHQFQLHPGDAVYIFSDGYADQFGGEKGKKFMYKPFKKMLAEIANLKMDKQGEYIRKAFHEWKGRLEQIDDVCVMGVKV